jgi:putative hydroxymethylpyrimidine transport system permease protein
MPEQQVEVMGAILAPPKNQDKRLKSRLKRAWPPAAVLLSVVVIWEVAVRVFDVPKYILPAPTSIISTLVSKWTSSLASATWVTLTEVLIGFVLSLVTAILIAVTLHASEHIRRGVYPLLIGSQTIPIVVIGPILAIIFGYNIVPKVLLVTLICFFPIVVTTIDGLASVDPMLIRMMKTLYGTRWSIFTRVEFPAALPSMFSGIRVAASYAAIGAVFGEYAGSSNGLGYVMIQATPQLQTAMVFAAILLLSAISVVMFILVTAAERFLIPWADDGKSL